MKRTILLFLRPDGKKNAEIALITQTVSRIAAAVQMPVCIFPDIPDACGLIFAVGGDGTFLDASHEALALDVPLAGINAGSLGFLTEISPDEESEIERIVEGRFAAQERIVLDVVLRGGDGCERHRGIAVNELFVSRRLEAPMIDFALRYAQMNLPHYKSDGIIVATPTGSTGYNLSLSGPILFRPSTLS